MKILSMSSVGKFYLLFAFIFVFPSCLDTIELDPPDGLEEALVIQGILLKGKPNVIEVRLSRLYNFTVSSYSPVNALKGFLLDQAGNRLELIRRGDGFLRLEIPNDHPSFQIKYNRSYSIELQMPDGRTIVSGMEPLIPVTKVDAIHYERITKFVPSQLDPDASILDTFVRFSVDTQLKLEDQSDWARFRWQAARTYKITELPQVDPPRDTCYITEVTNVFEPRLYDGNQLKSYYLSQQTVFDQPLNFKFAEGYYFSVFQESLSEGAFTYWSQIDQLLNRTGNMFETPPGIPFTNLQYNEERKTRLYGYFYCTERDTLRQYVPPITVTNQDTFCTQFIGALVIPAICTRCEEEIGASTSPPPFWKEN